MDNIWHYSTTADGLYSNSPLNIVGDRDGNVFASFSGAVSMLPKGANRWSTLLTYVPQAWQFQLDVCVNEESNTFFAACVTNDPTQGGLFVRYPNGKTTMITKLHYGIASNEISGIAVNYSYSTQDPLGAVRLIHADVLGFSKYHVEPGELQGQWTVHFPSEWKEAGVEYFNSIRIFNNTIYVGANNLLSYSNDDGESWTNLTSFTVNYNHGPDEYYPPSNITPEVADVYVDELNHVYMLCSFRVQEMNYSYLFRSTDQMQTWDYLLYKTAAPFNSITAYGDNLYIESDSARRVWNKKSGSVKVFTPEEMRGDLYAKKTYVDATVNGNWYVPTTYSGVAIASLTDVEQYPVLWNYANTSTGLSTNTITCISGVDDTSAASQTEVYAGGSKGLSVTIDGGKTWSQIVQTRTGVILSEKVINDLDYYYLPGYTNVAVATSDDGVVRIIDSGLGPVVADVHYTTSNGLASNTVQCVHMQRNGAIIAGHLGEGLSIQPTMTALSWKVLTKKDGLAGDYFLSVKADRDTGKRMYGAGYDLSSDGEIKGALSVSKDGGATWTAIQKFMLAGSQNGLTFLEVLDVIEDPRWNEGKPYIYICAHGQLEDVSSFLFALLRSADMGQTWDLLGAWSADEIKEGQIALRTRMVMTSGGMMLIPFQNKIFVYNVDTQINIETSWPDGLFDSNSGALFIDRNGQIYAGTEGRGVAISNTSLDLGGWLG